MHDGRRDARLELRQQLSDGNALVRQRHRERARDVAWRQSRRDRQRLQSLAVVGDPGDGALEMRAQLGRRHIAERVHVAGAPCRPRAMVRPP